MYMHKCIYIYNIHLHVCTCIYVHAPWCLPFALQMSSCNFLLYFRFVTQHTATHCNTLQHMTITALNCNRQGDLQP